MREIKFRGFDEENQKWVYGDLFYGHENVFIMVIEEKSDNYIQVRYTAVKPETVGQFIGLTDENNNPIYEGDIVRETEEYEEIDAIGVVKFYMSGFYVDNGSEEWWSPDSSFEVIGNVHQNKELLEGR